MRSSFFLCMLVLVGCATPPQPTWVKTGATPEQTGQAKADCDYQAAAATQQTDSTMRGGLAAVVDREWRKDDLMTMCMKAKGFASPQRR